MKTMQPVLKMLFVVVLVGWALGRPMKAKADYPVGSYTCSSGFASCYTQATEQMSQCMGTCYEYGNDGTWNQLCYQIIETVTWYPSGDQLVDTSQTCNTVPALGYNCGQTCAVDFEFNMNSCLSQFCSLNS